MKSKTTRWYDIRKKVDGWFIVITRCCKKDMETYILSNCLKMTARNLAGDSYIDNVGNEYIISSELY